MNRYLVDICDIQYGFPFDSNLFNDTTGIPLVRIRDVKRGYSETYTTEEYSEEYIVRNGDILIGMDGEFNIARWGKRPAVLNQRVCKVIPHDEVDPDYIFYSLPQKLKNIENRTSFATVKHLSAKEINKIVIPVPDIDTQRIISKTITNVANIINQRQEQLNQLDILIKSRFVEMFGDFKKEEKYVGIPLGEICETMSGGTPSTKYPEYYSGIIPWISTVSLGPNHINGVNAKGYITEDAVVNSATKLIPAGNILFGTRVGVGKSSINDVDICINQDIVAIVGIDESKYNKLFIKHVLDAHQSYYDSIKKGATILGITVEDLKGTLIPMVPIELQKEYADLATQVDKSKSAIQKSLDETQLLFDSLMQQYFG